MPFVKLLFINYHIYFTEYILLFNFESSLKNTMIIIILKEFLNTPRGVCISNSDTNIYLRNINIKLLKVKIIKYIIIFNNFCTGFKNI